MGIALKEIERFQTDRGLDKKEYSPFNEHANIVEELLESIGIDTPKKDRKQLAANFADFIVLNSVDKPMIPTTKEDRVDAYCDIVVFAIGAILKLGFDPETALIEVGKEINSREGSMIDGKFEKDLSDASKAKWYKADYALAKI